eukprot:6211306-Pleurochrysis_carterae.AAC.1
MQRLRHSERRSGRWVDQSTAIYSKAVCSMCAFKHGPLEHYLHIKTSLPKPLLFKQLGEGIHSFESFRPSAHWERVLLREKMVSCTAVAILWLCLASFVCAA